MSRLLARMRSAAARFGARPAVEPAVVHDGPQPLFIDARVTVAEGERAAARLRRTNDSRFFSPSRGIVKVDRKRWREAQRYEERTWLTLHRGAADDRNVEHHERFDHFAPIVGRSFRRVIELGCGPFTNLRLLLEHIDAEAVELLDPLVDRYVGHPHCTYRDGTLAGRPVRLVASSIEDFRADATYDLVVMINVIEHCFDAELVFARVLELMGENGVFVFHDKLYPAESIDPQRLYDAGHPLRVRAELVEEFLDAHFEPALDRTEHDPEIGLPMRYFIGTRVGRP
jgi:SAM-dependent methyltransferase